MLHHREVMKSCSPRVSTLGTLPALPPPGAARCWTAGWAASEGLAGPMWIPTTSQSSWENAAEQHWRQAKQSSSELLAQWVPASLGTRGGGKTQHTPGKSLCIFMIISGHKNYTTSQKNLQIKSGFYMTWFNSGRFFLFILARINLI